MEEKTKEKVLRLVKNALIALLLFVQIAPSTKPIVLIRVLLFAVLLVFIFYIEPKLKGIKIEGNARSHFKLSIVIIIFFAILFSEIYFTFWR